jgi:hypothetical protein
MSSGVSQTNSVRVNYRIIIQSQLYLDLGFDPDSSSRGARFSNLETRTLPATLRAPYASARDDVVDEEQRIHFGVLYVYDRRSAVDAILSLTRALMNMHTSAAECDVGVRTPLVPEYHYAHAKAEG